MKAVELIAQHEALTLRADAIEFVLDLVTDSGVSMEEDDGLQWLMNHLEELSESTKDQLDELGEYEVNSSNE